jgi:hypothetical protein
MTTLEEIFQQACDSRDLPGVVLVASDAKGDPAHLSRETIFN